MNKKIKTMLQGVLCAGALAASAAVARAQIEVSVGFPTPEFIATTSPIVFEGHSAYWFGGRWYYRDGGAWRYYRDEPVFLRDRRMQRAPDRHFYGRAHGGGFRPAAHAAPARGGRGGGGGARGGGRK
jgi:hypothetical protein